MAQFISRRVGYCFLSLLLLSLTIFFFVRVTGDPAALLVEPGASAADIAEIHRRFGLDRPLWEQFGLFMWALARGDLGQSFYYQTPVLELYLSRLPHSLLLATAAMGVLAGHRHSQRRAGAVRVGRFWDSAGQLSALLGLSAVAFGSAWC
jgi:peptide/nickel transport system permease protein